MSRNLTTATKNEFIAPSLRPIFLIEATFTTTIRVWTGIGNISWNSQTWSGLGELLSISEIEETADVVATGIRIGLSGIAAADIQRVMNESRQGKAVNVYFGAIDSSGVVVVDPFLSFAGRMDAPEINEGAETSTITIAAESKLIDLNRSMERRYTAEDQKSEYAGDLGFDYVPSLQEWNGVWGQGQGIPTTGGGTSSGLVGVPNNPGYKDVSPFDGGPIGTIGPSGGIGPIS